MRKNAPGDARQLVGEGDGEHVVVQPLLGRLEPWLEPVALPALGLDQYNPCRLDEQDINPFGNRIVVWFGASALEPAHD